MRTKDTLEARPLVFLAVLMLHAVIVLLLIRPARLLTNSRTSDEPLILMLLRSGPPPAAVVAAPRPSVDWQHEAELAAQNAVAGAEREGNFRNLSSLTPLQLDWIKRNHMEPAPPGIHWKRPRVEVTPGGLPIIWINERCVLVIVMVFCGIGHIEADGGLFNQMGDPQ